MFYRVYMCVWVKRGEGGVLLTATIITTHTHTQKYVLLTAYQHAPSPHSDKKKISRTPHPPNKRKEKTHRLMTLGS
jgi:hypothetical protein